MKLQTLKSIIEKKKNKSEFAIITNLKTGKSEIFEKDKPLSKEMEIYSNQISEFFKSKKNGVIENSELFIETIPATTPPPDPFLSPTLIPYTPPETLPDALIAEHLKRDANPVVEIITMSCSLVADLTLTKESPSFLKRSAYFPFLFILTYSARDVFLIRPIFVANIKN